MTQNHENPDTIWINVNTEEGMFPTERIVMFKLLNGIEVDFFVDNHNLKEEKNSWFLKVLKIKPVNNGYRVLLPNEPYQTQSRWADIPISIVV